MPAGSRQAKSRPTFRHNPEDTADYGPDTSFRIFAMCFSNGDLAARSYGAAE